MQTSSDSEELRLEEWSRRTDSPAVAHSRPWLCLAAAVALLPFANGANNISLAAWLAPVFLLRFVRKESPNVGLLVAYVLLVAAFAFQFRGMVPIPGMGYYIFLFAWGVPSILPYAVDRFLGRRLPWLTASLVFPAAWASTEYVLSRSPYGSWGLAAYSQYGNLALLQVLSVTGMWGITFLMGWFAAVCNWIWEEGLDSRRVRAGAWVFIGTIATVMLLGGARLALNSPSSQTVRVASISRREVETPPSPAIMGRMWYGNANSDDLDAFRIWSTATGDDLLARAEKEMQAGAKIVFWSELNALLLREQEATFIERGAELAAKHHAFLGMAIGVLNDKNTCPCENKLVLIRPDGLIAWQYSKAHPVPGGEAAQQARGDGRLRELDTPYGRLSSIICFDGDFPQLLAQAGALRADMMLDPSKDWLAIDPWHTQMSSFRAIEQGFNLIRQTSEGLSAAYDYQGRQLASMDHFQTTDYAMVSQVPTRGVRTIYSKLGDWFAWACMVGLVLLTILSVRQKHV